MWIKDTLKNSKEALVSFFVNFGHIFALTELVMPAQSQ